MLARTASSASAARSALHLGRAVAPLRRLSSLPPHTFLPMPALSPSPKETHAHLIQWLKKEGDKVEEGDEVAEIETDKATLPEVAQDEYYLAKILVPDGTNDVEIGAPIAVRVDEKEHIDAFKDFTAPTDGATPAPAAAAPATSAGAAPAAATPNPAAAAAPAASVAGVSMPAVGGRIYWNEAKGWFRA